MKLLEGVYSALFSVYDEQLNVKKDTVEKMINYQLDNGIKGFYVGGATGECVVLPAKTRKQMLEASVEVNKGRGQIVAHIGASHFEETMELLDHANNMDIDAISSLPPSLMGYYGLSEIVDYYKTLAKKSKHPIYAYINPYVASVMSANLVGFAKEMANIDNIVGLKISLADYYAFGKVATSVGDKLNLLNGPDECFICGLSIGADGAIGTTYNIAPKLAVEIYDKFKAGDMAGALVTQRKMNDIIGVVLGKNIAGWKDVLRVMGYDMGYTVYPAKLQNEEELQILKANLEKINFFDMVK